MHEDEGMLEAAVRELRVDERRLFGPSGTPRIASRGCLRVSPSSGIQALESNRSREPRTSTLRGSSP